MRKYSKEEITEELLESLIGKRVNAKVRRYSHHQHWSPLYNAVVKKVGDKVMVCENESYGIISLMEIEVL